MNRTKDFLIGCSFTDPTWQSVKPWSVIYGEKQPCYISAKAGMGIKGICTEAVYWLDLIKDEIKTAVIVLPTLWRYDMEVDEETYLCNSMTDLLTCDQNDWRIHSQAVRKWITTGGLHYDKSTEMAPVFDFLYRHQGFLVIAKEHFRALERLIDHCKCHKIDYVISAIQDPLDQLLGLDYIRDRVIELLQRVEYNNWLRFDGHFIDKFLGHSDHPSDSEHEILCSCIKKHLQLGKPNGKTV